jgi:hypothetical protein
MAVLLIVAVLVIPRAVAAGLDGLDPRVETDVWYLLVTGTVLPLVISLIQQRHWNTTVQSIVALVVCIAAASAISIHAGVTSGQGVAGAAIIVITVTKALYEAFWKPTGIAPAIENATTVGGS